MTWLERLAQAPRRLKLEGGAVELLSWHHEAELRDNVPHRHTFYEVCLVGTRGAAHFVVENQRHNVGPGDLFFARPGVVHQIVNTQRRGLELFWLCWAWQPHHQSGTGKTSSDTARLMAAFAASQHLVSPRDARVTTAWLALRAAATGVPAAAQNAQLTAAITALVLAIAQSGSPELTATETPGPRTGAGELAARAAVRYIADNLDGDMSIETIAAQLHLSPRHFARVFTAFAGSAPSLYIERARLHRAADLLLHSALAVKEVAARVGYADVRYFTRRFALLHGAPPATFRERGAGRVRIIHNDGDLV